MTQTFPQDTVPTSGTAGTDREPSGFSHLAESSDPGNSQTQGSQEQEQAAGSSGQDVAIAAIMAIAGLVLMLPAIGMMPNFGRWMDEHGPYVVMLPFMLWMMLAGGLLSNGVMKIIAAARGK